jgi:NIPSNAP
MIDKGELDIFRRAGFSQVLFGDALIGSRLPRLTYMVSFSDLKQLDDLWNAFRSDPQWKKLVASPEFSFEPIVNNVTNLVLNPAPYSQI